MNATQTHPGDARRNCQPHADARYHVQTTRAGDIIIRNRADRELARVPDRQAADAWIERDAARRDAETQLIDAKSRRDNIFTDAHPTDVAREVRWYDERNQMFDRLCLLGRYANYVGAQAPVDAAAAPPRSRTGRMMSRAESYATEYAQAQAEYDAACELDRRIKTARLAHDLAAWQAVLDESDRRFVG